LFVERFKFVAQVIVFFFERFEFVQQAFDPAAFGFGGGWTLNTAREASPYRWCRPTLRCRCRRV
jgi:hypothetical protein